MRQRWSIGRFRGRITLSHVIPTDVVFFAAREKIFPAPFLFTCQLLQSAFAPTTGQCGVAVEEGTKGVISGNFSVYGGRKFNDLQRKFLAGTPRKELIKRSTTGSGQIPVTLLDTVPTNRRALKKPWTCFRRKFSRHLRTRRLPPWQSGLEYHAGTLTAFVKATARSHGIGSRSRGWWALICDQGHRRLPLL